jgi:hypothetical protein
MDRNLSFLVNIRLFLLGADNLLNWVDFDPLLKKEKFEKTISSTMTIATAPSLESSTEKMKLGHIKTEPCVVGSTLMEEDVDEDDEGALIIDDNASPCQEDDEEELRDSQKNCHNETLDEIVAHDTKPDTTENDLTNDLTINDSKSSDTVDSSKQTEKYSLNKPLTPDSKNTTSVDTPVSEQLPLEMLIKEEEDVKAKLSTSIFIFFVWNIIIFFGQFEGRYFLDHINISDEQLVILRGFILYKRL